MSGGCAIAGCRAHPRRDRGLCQRHWGNTPAELRERLIARRTAHKSAIWRVGDYRHATKLDCLIAKLASAAAMARICSWWAGEPAA